MRKEELEEGEELEDEDEECELSWKEREYYSDPELMYGDIDKYLQWNREWERRECD